MLRTPTPYRTPAQRDQDFLEQQRLKQERPGPGNVDRFGIRLVFRTGVGASRYASTVDLEVVDENETQVFSMVPELWEIVQQLSQQLFEYAHYQAMGIQLLHSCCQQALEFMRDQYSEFFNGIVVGEIRHYDDQREPNHATRVIRHFEVKPEGTETLPSRDSIAVIVDPAWTDVGLLKKQLERFIDATELEWNESYRIFVMSPPTPTLWCAEMAAMDIRARRRHILALTPPEEYDEEQAHRYVDEYLRLLREHRSNPALVVFAKSYQDADPLTCRAWNTAQREGIKVYHIKP